MNALTETLRFLFGTDSLRKIAQKTGLSHNFIWLLKRGEDPRTGEPVRPSADKLKKISIAYNYPYEHLLELAGIIDDEFMQNESNDVDDVIVHIPVLGEVRAGQPMYADEQVIDFVPVPQSEVKNGEYFYLQVKGDSMQDACILDGSRVLVRRQTYVDSGSIAVVLADKENATIKKIRYWDGKVMLIPANAKYEPQIYNADEVSILGKVVKSEVRYA